jgi:hypothetical protein
MAEQFLSHRACLRGFATPLGAEKGGAFSVRQIIVRACRVGALRLASMRVMGRPSCRPM